MFKCKVSFFFRTQLAFKKVQFLTINVVWWVCKHHLNRQKKTAIHFLFFIYKILTWIFNYITYINKLYYIYKQVFLGHLGCTVFIQETFLFIHAHIYTCMHMHTPINLHARTRCTHYMWKSLTQPAPKVSSKIIPIDSSSFTMFLFVSFIILCNPKLHALYLSIQILPSRSPGNHLSFVDRVQEITVISHILPKSACCLLSGAIRIIWCCKRLKSYGNTNTAWF